MKTIVFDFDGVIHRYREGYKDGTIYDEANTEVIYKMLTLMKEGYSVAVVSARSAEQIQEWFLNGPANIPFATEIIHPSCIFWNKSDVVGITNTKLAAVAYIDDRAINFNGDISKLNRDLQDIIQRKGIIT